MKLKGTRFGEIEFSKSDIIHFEEGMIGFQKLKRYVVVNTKLDSPYRWLQSLDEPKLAFLVSVPEFFVAEYAPAITDSEAQLLGLSPNTEHLVLVTTTIPAGNPRAATANLAAPVIINLESRKAKQVILEDEAYTIRYPIFSGANPDGKLAAA
ncbi:MAG: flagellar assembly protein FliW [Armatimonadota bacterium]